MPGSQVRLTLSAGRASAKPLFGALRPLLISLREKSRDHEKVCVSVYEDWWSFSHLSSIQRITSRRLMGFICNMYTTWHRLCGSLLPATRPYYLFPLRIEEDIIKQNLSKAPTIVLT
jgi:hypothetical protein